MSDYLVRIIPARAGFTPATRDQEPSHPDHPRSRGVYPRCAASARPVLGSSPLARGLLLPAALARVGVGIIPARAGFTPPWSRRWSTCPDHPRSRGVYIARFFTDQTEPGSSPLARGLPGAGDIGHGGCRIIPARAGFTPAQPARRLIHRDHPRSRGVYAARCVSVRSGWGSSPLARGLRRRWESGGP